MRFSTTSTYWRAFARTLIYARLPSMILLSSKPGSPVEVRKSLITLPFTSRLNFSNNFSYTTKLAWRPLGIPQLVSSTVRKHVTTHPITGTTFLFIAAGTRLQPALL
ncbi:hypothetical protein BDR04DRAFT_169430 [Suillus decipiens]|nr:hypothetical protein BDR04DRAFT_169430 [Suillus decipiens]